MYKERDRNKHFYERREKTKKEKTEWGKQRKWEKKSWQWERRQWSLPVVVKKKKKKVVPLEQNAGFTKTEGVGEWATDRYSRKRRGRDTRREQKLKGQREKEEERRKDNYIKVNFYHFCQRLAAESWAAPWVWWWWSDKAPLPSLTALLLETSADPCHDRFDMAVMDTSYVCSDIRSVCCRVVWLLPPPPQFLRGTVFEEAPTWRSRHLSIMSPLLQKVSLKKNFKKTPTRR